MVGAFLTTGLALVLAVAVGGLGAVVTLAPEGVVGTGLLSADSSSSPSSVS